MERILDIHGYKTNLGEENYSKEDSWFGRILVGDDQQFEGIVQDWFQENYFFVFGQLTQDSLNLTKCSLEDKETPCVFDAYKEEGKIEGSVFSKGAEEEKPLGTCRMTIIPAGATRDETDYERTILHNKIALIKLELGEMGNALEQDFAKARKGVSIEKK